MKWLHMHQRRARYHQREAGSMTSAVQWYSGMAYIYKCILKHTNKQVGEAGSSGFLQHITNDHNMWKYLFFQVYLRERSYSEYSGTYNMIQYCMLIHVNETACTVVLKQLFKLARKGIHLIFVAAAIKCMYHVCLVCMTICRCAHLCTGTGMSLYRFAGEYWYDAYIHLDTLAHTHCRQRVIRILQDIDAWKAPCHSRNPVWSRQRQPAQISKASSWHLVVPSGVSLVCETMFSELSCLPICAAIHQARCILVFLF
jgi:hypothetical protein